MNKLINKVSLFGSVQIPPSKSDSQRAILAASLSTSTTVLYNIGVSNDEKSMMENCSLLGAKFNHVGDGKYIVEGIQAFPQKATLNVGESGLGLRLITAVCAAHNGEFHITGEGSILERNQTFFEEHLTQLGVSVESNDGFLPLKIVGPISGGELVVDGSMSSQFLSGLLMALPLIEANSTLKVNNLKSVPYVKMTLNTLNDFGVQINYTTFDEFNIPGNQNYNTERYAIQSDWSSASYWLVASALGHDIKLVGLLLDTNQADVELLEALTKANCAVVADETGIHVDGTNRKPFSFDATHCPDLFPALVSFACFCDGITTLKGVHRLKNKESDRGVVLKEEFEKLGASIEISEDQMTIDGSKLLRGANVDSHNDHRIAMCLAVTGINLEGEMKISGAEAVNKSYPEFWNHLDSLTTQ